MKLQKLSAALLVAGLTTFGSAYAVPTITLNPSALNGGVGCDFLQIDVSTTCNAAGNGQAGQYVVSSIQTSLDSILNITSTSGAGAWTETGAMIFNTYNGGNQRNGARGLGSGGDYDIYGLISGSGGGFWTAINGFTVTSITSFIIDIYASPELGTSIARTTGGLTQGSNDFLLGTATFAGSFGGTGAQLDLVGGVNASTQLTATFSFVPADIAYTAVGGFFQAPDPFSVNFNGSGSSNEGQSTYEYVGSGVKITTGNGATGNLTPVNTVPEPGSLALFSVALLGAGIAARRKSANKG
jgi:hypothetical protein